MSCHSTSSPSSSSSRRISSATDYTSSSDLYYSDMSTASSTPVKRGLTGVENFKQESAKTAIRIDVTGKCLRNVGLRSFVTHVWGVDSEVIKHITSRKDWVLLPAELKLYSDATYEPHMYAPFAKIAESITAQATKAVKELRPNQSESRIVLWHSNGTQAFQSPVTKVKPDMCTVDKEVIQETPTWAEVLHIFELKRESYAKGERLQVAVSPSTSSAPASLEKSKSPAAGPPLEEPSLKKRKTQRKRSTPVTPIASLEVPSHVAVPATSSGSKRKRSDSSGTRSHRHFAKMTGSGYQIVQYALKCLNASLRNYVSGVWIDRFQVSLWYFDRACIIQTKKFDFKDHPELLALVLYAVSACNDKEAGFDPQLAYPSTPRPRNLDKSLQHWQDVVGANINFLSSDGSPSPGPSLRIEETLYAYRGIIGRGTMVYRVARLSDPARSLALKISWPLVTRKPEAETIEQLRARLPNWRDHLPEVIFSAKRTAEELGLPRVELLNTYPFKGLEDRWQHALVMKLYGKLWKVGSVEAFQDVFVDCLECHYHAYTDAKVLHRDLSENNLMFKRTDDASDGKVKGILNDWDMASDVEANDQILPSTATHRTGTIPFMAIDLLVVDGRPPPHLYRHDLESFFYILVWAAFYYDFDKKERRSTAQSPLERRWNNVDLEVCADKKDRFLLNPRAREELFALVPPEGQSLLPWMRSAWSLFSKANVARGINFDTPEAGWDDKTSGGILTFENFMEALGRKPRL